MRGHVNERGIYRQPYFHHRRLFRFLLKLKVVDYEHGGAKLRVYTLSPKLGPRKA